MMWVYEKRVFGKTHTDDGARIETKPSASAKTGNMMSTMDEPCGRVCLPDGGSCGDWEGDCGDGDGDGWDDGGDLGPPDYGDSDGGSGGGGGGQGDNRDNDDDENNDPECENNAVNVPFPGLMDPDEEDDPYPGPSNPSPCEEGDEDAGSENRFLGDIDTSDLANHPKAECIYKKLDKTKTMQKVVSKFAGEYTQFDLIFKVKDIANHPNALGGTTRTPNKSREFTIIIDKSHLSTNASLDVARTILHEGIHAELRRKVASIGGIDNIDEMSFPGIFDYYQRYGEDWPHNQMAQHYRDIMIEGMKEYDNNRHSIQFYNNLAWRGLEGTQSWKEKVSSAENTQIKQTYQDLMNESGSTQCN